jgi:hypothetical protein
MRARVKFIKIRVSSQDSQFVGIWFPTHAISAQSTAFLFWTFFVLFQRFLIFLSLIFDFYKEVDISKRF